MIFRLLLLAAAAFIVWKLLRILLGPRGPAPVSGDEADPTFQRMVRCPQCGVHLPAADTDPEGRCPQCRG